MSLRKSMWTMLAAMALLAAHAAIAQGPSWARGAQVFPVKCEAANEFYNCKPVKMVAPDDKTFVEVRYRVRAGVSSASLRLRAEDGRESDVAIPRGFQDIELMWSPDSKRFFLNGGDGGAYWGFWVYAYQVDNPRPIRIARKVRLDMLRQFPLCKAAWVQASSCSYVRRDPLYPNLTGIAWLPDSSAMVVMAEIPCSGTLGGVACQVMGYEVEVPTGRILRRMTARQFKNRWQSAMAFQMQIPAPPEYVKQ